ncbi:MAG TPA: prephenate dehydrogenase [Bacillales bacterium]|nr:prephenate dehydrogenase [Bacillales bacterium]
MQGNRVFVIGLGLIGGSLALAIKKQHPSTVIAGYDVNKEQIELAESLGVIDEQVEQIEEGVPSADVMIIAAPVLEAETIIDRLLTCSIKDGAIVTDVGSTKQEIMMKAKSFHEKGVTFIGGHPLAGSHKTGVGAARAHLFENAFYVLIAGENGQEEEVEKLKNLLAGTKATFIEMTPDEHDRIVGTISHFPHIVAAGLVHQLAGIDEERFDVRPLAAGGFRDITRIASASPAMWHDVLIHNRAVLLRLMEKWQSEMTRVREMIENVDSRRIFAYFQDAKQFRDTLPRKEKGAIPALYDLYVDVPDYPGVIAQVTDVIAKAEISITNIRIIEMREDIIGVLRLTFRSDEDRELAEKVLNAENYKTYLAD